MLTRKSLRAAVGLGALVLVGLCGCRSEDQRTEPVSSSLRGIVVAADSVEVFVVDGLEASNYRPGGHRDLPVGSRVELLGGAARGFYAVERLGVLDKKARKDVETLLFGLDNYSTALTICDFEPHYAFRYGSARGTAILFLDKSCSTILILSAKGEKLDGGNVMPSSKKWEGVVARL